MRHGRGRKSVKREAGEGPGEDENICAVTVPVTITAICERIAITPLTLYNVISFAASLHQRPPDNQSLSSIQTPGTIAGYNYLSASNLIAQT
ncbi:unnamed protein product [Hydatigera taeniaeformis]|uniref:Uncharacterized protein n=1 Tax=Hydatigena taeniaeformis TaxID=6205 RepID=A0A0R3WXU3_HYDTA|nr:unnamed protein product [Hydatigera taeniaeformis]